MRCSLKAGFVILLIVFFAPSEGKSRPLYLRKRPIADRLINFNNLWPMSRVEQSLDSFPNLVDYDKNAHRIVKKQMTVSDYKHGEKNKRSVFSLRQSPSCKNDFKFEYGEKVKRAMIDWASGDRNRREKSEFSEKTEKQFHKKRRSKGHFIYRRGILNKFQKRKKINEKEMENASEKGNDMPNVTVMPLDKSTEKTSQKQNGKANEKASEKALEKATETTLLKQNEKAVEKPAEGQKAKAGGKEIEKGLGKENEKALEIAVAKEKQNENIKKNNASGKKITDLQKNNLTEQCKLLKSMIGCKMENFCRVPDIQDNHCYFECESDNNGCIILTHKRCPNEEIFSSRFLECLQPFFWKLVEREKRSLWKKEKKQQYSNTWTGGLTPNAWTDVTHEEGKLFPLEFRPRYKPKLVVYHLKVKKAINEPLRKKKKQQRHTFGLPHPTHAGASRILTHKVGSIKRNYHQLFPRSFVIRINKKEGRDDHISVEDKDETEDDSDDDDDEAEDDDDGEDTNEEEEEEDANDEGNKKKTTEKSGIKEFFRSAKEALTNKARFSEPADTSFTLDKTNPCSKNKKLDSEKDSSKILLDADIKVDKTLGKTLKRILEKRKDRENGITSLNEKGKQDQGESDQITMYENLIRSNPRLKRYFLLSLGDKGN